MRKSTTFLLLASLGFLTACGDSGINLDPSSLSTSPSISSGNSTTSSQSFTLAKYNQIVRGMTESQVIGILGQPSAKDILNIGLGDTVTLSWKNSTGGFQLITVTFQDNKVTNKSESGLK